MAERFTQGVRSGVRPRILLVDTDPITRRRYSHMLGSRNDLVLAESGAEALSFLERGEAFDLIVSDLNMAGLSGAELYRRSTTKRPDLVDAFVFSTDLGDEDVLTFLRSLGSKAVAVDKAFATRDFDHLLRARVAWRAQFRH